MNNWSSSLGSGLILLITLTAVAASGQDWRISGGITGADVGLHENKTGMALGVGRSLAFHDGWFDFTFLGEYVQKAGNQPREFFPADGPIYVDDEVIRLHYLQPSVLLGVRYPGRAIVPRLYAGLSLALKVNEAWSRPLDDGEDILSYEDIDTVAHVGASLQRNSLGVDFRYSFGLVSQLIVQQKSFPKITKAEYPLEGIAEPEDGAKLTNWRLGLTWIF